MLFAQLRVQERREVARARGLWSAEGETKEYIDRQIRAAPEKTLMCSMPTRDSPPGGLGVVGRDGIGVVERDIDPSFGFPPSVQARASQSVISCSTNMTPTIFETVKQVSHIDVAVRTLQARYSMDKSPDGAGKGGGASLTTSILQLGEKRASILALVQTQSAHDHMLSRDNDHGFVQQGSTTQSCVRCSALRRAIYQLRGTPSSIFVRECTVATLTNL
jgi:hypothetical protein